MDSSCKSLSAAAAPLALSPWSTTELHSALALKMRTHALSPTQADAVLRCIERHLAPGLLLLDPPPEHRRQPHRSEALELRPCGGLILAYTALHTIGPVPPPSP